MSDQDRAAVIREALRRLQCGFDYDGERTIRVELLGSLDEVAAVIVAALGEQPVGSTVTEWQQKWKRRGLVIERLKAQLARAEAESAEHLALLDGRTARLLVERDAQPVPNPSTSAEALPCDGWDSCPNHGTHPTSAVRGTEGADQ